MLQRTRSRAAVVDERLASASTAAFSTTFIGTDDEVNGVEILTITLPTATTLAGFTVSNLYYESLLGLGIAAYQEIGYYKLGDGAWQAFTAPRRTRPIPPGSCTSASRPRLVSTIAFGYKPGFGLLDAVKNDFSVKSLDVVATPCNPEPARCSCSAPDLAAVAIRARKVGRRRAN